MCQVSQVCCYLGIELDHLEGLGGVVEKAALVLPTPKDGLLIRGPRPGLLDHVRLSNMAGSDRESLAFGVWKGHLIGSRCEGGGALCEKDIFPVEHGHFSGLFIDLYGECRGLDRRRGVGLRRLVRCFRPISRYDKAVLGGCGIGW